MPKILLNKSNVDLDYPICRPSLDLDFTQEVLDERITFSRGSIGTRVNRNRLIETVSANQPRFDYDQITGECKGLLIEESRSNLINNSTNIITGGGAVGLSTTTDGTLAPDGSNAILYIPTTGTTYHGNSSAITTTINLDTSGIATGSTYTFSYSMWLKDYNQSDLGVLFVSSGYLAGTPATNVTYDLRIAKPKTGTWVGGGLGPEWTILTQKAVLYPNGWYRFVRSIRYTRPANQNRIDFGWQVFNNRDAQFYRGDGTSGIYIWGPQVETGAFETSYIPTSGSTVTRSADNANMTGTNFSSWYNQTEGTLYASINNITTRSSITFDRFVALVGTDVNRNVISICTQTAAGGGAQNKFIAGVSYSPDGSYVVDTFTGAVSGGGGPDRIGKAIIAYKKDNFAFTVNGITPLRDISGDIPTCNQLLIFGSARFQPAPSGTISRLTYYPRALKPNQLQYLTQ